MRLALLSALLLTPLALAEPFQERLEVTLEPQYSVRRLQSGSEFLPITLSPQAQEHVPLIWQSPPAFEVVCTNGHGWSVTLRGPAQLPGPGGSGLPIDYEYGTGSVVSIDSSDPAPPRDSRGGGSLAAGVKVLSVAAATLGSYRYTVGNFQVPRLAAEQAPGSYGGAGLLVTTFSNTP